MMGEEEGDEEDKDNEDNEDDNEDDNLTLLDPSFRYSNNKIQLILILFIHTTIII